MGLKISTDVIDYMAQLKTINANNDIVLLKSDTYRGLYTVGTDNKLYAYHEQSGVDAPFVSTEIYSPCSQFAATRMGNTSYFAFAVVSGDEVYTCVSNTPETLKQENFNKLDFTDVLGGEKLNPVELFINGNDIEATMAVMMKDESGRIQQFIAYYSMDYPTSYSYYSLAANFDTIVNSVCGRAVKQPVDGIYTFGTYTGKPQLLYTPITNVFSDTKPAPVRLSVPGNRLDCIATCQLMDMTGTHLFAVCENALYIYPYEKQFDCKHIDYSNYDKIAESVNYADAIKIEAYLDIKNQKMYVWVLNRSGKLTYTFAKISESGLYDTFVEPMVCKENIVYFDASPDTLSLSTEDELLIGTRNDACGYTFNHVNIASDTGELAVIRSFATKVITEKPNDSVRITSTVPIEAYVNNTFYRFTDITVKSDGMCAIDIVQNADGIQPLPFQINSVLDDVDVDDKQEYFSGQTSYDKVLSLNTDDLLKGAQILDMHGKKRALAAGLSDEQIRYGAESIAQLSAGAISMSANLGMMYAFREPQMVGGIIGDVWDCIDEAWDYVCGFAKSFWDNTLGKVISFAVDIVVDIIQFTIKIGEEVLILILDTAGKILKCAVKILEFIGIPVTEILNWLLSFLDIDGAIRMKDFMEELTLIGLYGTRDKMKVGKEEYVKAINKLIVSIENWAELDEAEIRLPEKIDNDEFNQTSSNMLLFNAIFKIADVLSIDIDCDEPPEETKGILQKILDIISETSISDVTGQLEQLSDDLENIENINDIINVMKKIVGILSVDALTLFDEIGELLFDLLISAIDWFADVCKSDIHIPYISAVFDFFGIENVSIMDMVFMPPAFCGNLIYYTITGDSVITEEMMDEAKKGPISLLTNNGFSLLQQSENNEINEDLIKKLFDLNQDNLKWVVTFQIGIGVCYILDGFISGLSLADDKNRIFKITLTFVLAISSACNFVLSWYSGKIYEPMKYWSDKTKVGYDYMWKVNFGLNLTFNMIDIIAAFFIEEDDDDVNPITRIIHAVETVFLGLGAIASIVCESMAMKRAAEVEWKQYDADSVEAAILDMDRKIYYVQVSGFILADLVTIEDLIINIITDFTKNIYVYMSMAGIRAVSGIGEAAFPFAQAGIVKSKFYWSPIPQK